MTSRPNVEFSRAVATLYAAGRYYRDEDGRHLADCPVCDQGMRIDGQPGSPARFTCFAGTPEREIAERVRELAERPARARDGAATSSAFPSPRTPSSLVPSSPSTNRGSGGRASGCEAGRGSEVESLLRDHLAGRVEPVVVELPALPPDASPAMRKVAEFFTLVRGLRLYVGLDAGVPFAAGWVAEKVGIPKMSAWRAIQSLVKAGVLIEAGALPERRGKHGTKLYAPGAVEREPVGVEGRAEVGGQPGEPEAHVVDGPLVAGAELAVREGALAAARDGAGDGGGRLEVGGAAVVAAHRDGSSLGNVGAERTSSGGGSAGAPPEGSDAAVGPEGGPFGSMPLARRSDRLTLTEDELVERLVADFGARELAPGEAA